MKTSSPKNNEERMHVVKHALFTVVSRFFNQSSGGGIPDRLVLCLSSTRDYTGTRYRVLLTQNAKTLLPCCY
jgi:hypothetical protein